MKKGIYIRISELETQLVREIGKQVHEWDDLEWGVIIATLAGEIFDENIFITDEDHARIFRGTGAVGILERCYVHATAAIDIYRIKTKKTSPVTNCISIHRKPKTRSLNYTQSLKRLKNALTTKKPTHPEGWHERINYNIEFYKNNGVLPKDKYKNEKRERKN